MDAKTKPPKVVIERTYAPCLQSCEQAIRLLLDLVEQREFKHKSVGKQGGPDNRPEDATRGIENGCDAESIIPGR